MSVQEANLKAIADAIREKDGTAEPIPAKDFPERIRAIPAMPEDVYIIDVQANDPEMGAVTGGGIVSQNMAVTAAVEAVENSGHIFTGWYSENTLISSDKKYSFPVKQDVSLIAEFSENKSRLPAGYTEVESITPNGAQYIDTGIVVSPPAIRIKMACSVSGIANALYGINARTGTTTSNYKYSIFKASASYSSKLVSVFASYGNSSSVNNPAVGTVNGVDFSSRIEIDADFEGKVLTVNGTSAAIASVPTSFASSGNLYIFSENNTYSSASSIRSIYTLYAFQIYASGVLVRDFVPCIDPDGIAGLFDLAGQSFYKTGITGGSFTPGPAV